MVETLRPHAVYLVGGAVRDLLRGCRAKDLDFLVDCQPADLLAKREPLRKALGRTIIVLDQQRGYLRICYKQEEGLDLAPRHGRSVEEDLARRDITFNAMAAGSDGQLVDPFGGLRDLQNGVVRATSARVLEEDPLRLLRCLRFAATLDFALAPETRRELPRLAPGLQQIAAERIWVELRAFLARARLPHVREFRQAGIAPALWSLSPQQLSWSWLEQWLQSPPGLVPERQPKTVLSMLCALVYPAARDLQQGQRLLQRLSPSKEQLRYCLAWWTSCSWLERSHPSTTREIHAFYKTAEECLAEVLEFTVLPAFGRPIPLELRERLLLAASGEGELRLEALPLSGDDLLRHLGRPPGPWLGPLLKELATVWACREGNTRQELLDYCARLL
jgi:tRNA nucleotidyltransferase/poly(A) polymerase